MKTKSRLCVVATLSALWLTACQPQQEQAPAVKKLEKFEFLLDWQAEPTYLGVYYAKDLGEFEKLGLDVVITQSWGANQAVSSVAAGSYKIATASGGATVLGYNNQAQIVSLAVLYPRIPTVIYGLAKSGIQAPTDLVGKTIGIYPGSITKNEFDAFVKIQKLDPSKLKIESLSGADIPLLMAGKLDAVLHYTEMSPVIVGLSPDVQAVGGKKVFELPLADFGVGGYGLNIVTSRQTLKQDAERIQNIAKATVEGYRAGCAEQQKAVAAFLKQFPEKDPAYVKESWSRVCHMLGPNPGAQNDEGWKQTIDVYRTLGLLTQPVEPKDILP